VDVERAAQAIWEAGERGVYYPPEWQGRLGTDEAYAVQLGILARHLARGERHAGWKVGLTARAMQEQQGVHEPVFGFLLESGHRPGGVTLRLADLIAPGFEHELCLTVGTPLQGPGVTVEQARAALAAAAPAIEVIERRGDFKADLRLSLTDNCQQKHFVTGPETRPLPPGLRLAETTVEILVNGRPTETASGSAVLGDPAASVAWLANRLAGFGRRIEAGHRIMSGSFTRQYLPGPGDRVEARFHPFGSVAVTFA
jgi:2-keto-4-pentenoate hydratase